MIEKIGNFAEIFRRIIQIIFKIRPNCYHFFVVLKLR